MSHDDLQISVVDRNTSVPYVSAPASVSFSNEDAHTSSPDLKGDALFRDLVAFVNPGSGGRQGPALLRDLSALIGSDRVFH